MVVNNSKNTNKNYMKKILNSQVFFLENIIYVF